MNSPVKIEIEIDGEMYETYSDGLYTNDIELYISESENEIVAVSPPIPGIVTEVFKKKGQRVKKGEKLVMIEAMKMYNIITSPEDGVVSSVFIRKGDKVSKKTILAEIQL